MGLSTRSVGSVGAAKKRHSSWCCPRKIVTAIRSVAKPDFMGAITTKGGCGDLVAIRRVANKPILAFLNNIVIPQLASDQRI